MSSAKFCKLRICLVLITVAIVDSAVANEEDLNLSDCEKYQDLVVGPKNKTCKVPGYVGVKGQCTVYKKCPENLRLPLTKSSCGPSEVFNVEQRKCVHDSSGEQQCAQSRCFPEENDASTSTGPIYRSDWSSKGHEHEKEVSSLSTIPFVSVSCILSVIIHACSEFM